MDVPDEIDSIDDFAPRHPNEDRADRKVFEWLDQSLSESEKKGLTRRPGVSEVDPARDFSSNDYLSLRRDPRIHEAGVRAAIEAGVGAGASPAVSGWSKPYDALIQELADWKKAESALAFSSGYAANLSVVAALVSAGDVVYSDRLAHACLIDGARLSGALLRVFPHNDAERLERVLQRDRGRFRRRLIVTESLFGMDGDIAPLPALAELAANYRAMLLADEAHATGLFGAEGQGLVEEAGLSGHECVIRMGTLSKAVGCQGGFVVGSSALISWLIQSARGWIYSTAMSPYLAGAAAEAVRSIRSSDVKRRHLCELSAYVRSRLNSLGWNVPDDRGPIVPVIVGDVVELMRIGDRLRESGFAVGVIRPPTVPKGTARLRISLNASHRREDVDRLTEILGVVHRDRAE
jgi:8-amino-7-oxononanoate synthase